MPSESQNVEKVSYRLWPLLWTVTIPAVTVASTMIKTARTQKGSVPTWKSPRLLFDMIVGANLPAMKPQIITETLAITTPNVTHGTASISIL